MAVGLSDAELLDFFDALDRLVAIDSVSPLSATAIEQIGLFLKPWNFAYHDHFWTRIEPASDVWVYMHVDTKPVGDIEAWNSPPFRLTHQDDCLVGRGVSDSKFQLLNALHVFSSEAVNLLIDGAEESEGRQAGQFLNERNVRKLVVVDGSSADPEQIYGGLCGQLDGTLVLDTGRDPLHPGRLSHCDIVARLSDLREDMKDEHFNLTRIQGGDAARSLTLERVSVGFDLRFGGHCPEPRAFLEKYRPILRQHYPPVVGRGSLKLRPIAPFSNPLGMTAVEFDTVWVLPGGRPENRAHRPNEQIAIAQIAQHRRLLKKFVASGFEAPTL